MVKKLVLSLCAGLLWMAPASAVTLTQLDLVGPHKAIFKTDSGLVKFTKDFGLVAMKDPRCPTESSIEFRSSAGVVNKCNLDCNKWEFTGRGYLYKDLIGAWCGVQKIKWKSQKMIVKLRGAGYRPVSGPVSFVEARVNVNEKSFCGKFLEATMKANTSLLVSGYGTTSCDPLPTPTPTRTFTPTRTPIPPTIGPSPTPTNTPTRTKTLTPSISPTRTNTPTPAPDIFIDSPVHGVFYQPGATPVSITVTGHVVNPVPGSTYTIKHGDNAPLTIIPNPAAGNTFSATFTGEAGNIFNAFVAELSTPTNFKARDRVVAIVGNSIPKTSFANQSIAMRLTDPGFNALQSAITGLVPLNPSAIIEPNTYVGSFCAATDPVFGTCLATADVYIVSVNFNSAFTIDIDAQPNFVEGDITLSNLVVAVHVEIWTGDCDFNFLANSILLEGDYGLQPKSGNPSQVDVYQNGSTVVTLFNFRHTEDCGGITGLFTGSIDFEQMLKDNLSDFLDTPTYGCTGGTVSNDCANPTQVSQCTTGGGSCTTDTAIARAVEGALAGVEIAGPLGASLGMLLEAPLFDVLEDVNGITLGTNTRVTTLSPAPGAPTFSRTYYFPEAFPTFGASAPGGQCYHVALCIGTAAFNKLLAGEVESGLLRMNMKQFDLNGDGTPDNVTAGGLVSNFFLFGFNALPASTPIKIVLKPTLAPIVTGNTGPHGELAELRIAQMLVEFVSCTGGSDPNTCDDPDDLGPLPEDTTETETVQIRLAVDIRVGLDLTFDNATGGLLFALSEPATTDIGVVVLDNPIRQDEFPIVNALPAAFAPLLPGLSDSLGSFAVPTFFNQPMQGVAVTRNGQFMSVFMRFGSTCTPAAG